MDASAYRTALTALGLTQIQAGAWLGVGRSTAQRYATRGPSPAAAKAIQGALKYGLW